MCGSSSLTTVTRPIIKKYSPWTLPTGAFVSTDGRNTYYVSVILAFTTIIVHSVLHLI